MVDAAREACLAGRSAHLTLLDVVITAGRFKESSR
jgi:hypothetical protein